MYPHKNTEVFLYLWTLNYEVNNVYKVWSWCLYPCTRFFYTCLQFLRWHYNFETERQHDITHTHTSSLHVVSWGGVFFTEIRKAPYSYWKFQKLHRPASDFNYIICDTLKFLVSPWKWDGDSTAGRRAQWLVWCPVTISDLAVIK